MTEGDKLRTENNACRPAPARPAGHVGMDVRGLGGRGQVTVLSLALVPVYWAWMRDETPDLAATMASLDKSLGHFEKIVNYLTPRAY